MSEQGIRLRPLFRKSDDHSANHFVRLSPCTALRLRDAATMAERNILSYDVARKVQPDLSSTPVRRNWSIGDTLVPSTLCALGIEFLPLEISTNDAETVYASYNGGDLDLREHSLVPEGEDDADSYIDIPSSLFLNISGNGKDHCTLKRNRFTWAVVKALSGVNCAKELLVEPLTVEDWELLELYALGLEEGGLLQQVSIVYAGQVLKLRLSNGAEACVCVLPGNFEHTNPVWPDDNAALPCLRLVAETRVNVAPKPRAKVGSLRLVPTREDYIKDPSILELAVRLNVNVVSVSQGTGVVNPNTMAKMRGRQTTEIDGIFDLVRLVASREAADAAADEPDSKSAIVRVSTSIDIPEGCIALHPLARMKIKVPIFSKQVVLMAKLLSPLDIAKLSKVVQEPVQSGLTRLCLRQVKVTQLSAKASWRSPDISSFAFIRGDFDPVTEPAVSLMDSLSVATDAPLEIGGYVSLPWQCIDGEGNCLYRLVLEPNSVDLYSAQINEGIVFASNLTNLLSDHQTIGGKSDLVTEEPQQPIDLPTSRPTFPEELLYITDLPTSPTLAELLPENSVFSLSMLCLIRASTGNSELLVYGDRGSGKTHSALTIAAAARLSCGSNTVYMDCRKVRDSPTVRMNAILGELSKAFVDAAANSPCILILDDLDSLTMDFTDNGSTDDSMQLQQVNPVEIDQSKLITDVLRSILRAKSNNVQVVVTCQTPDSLPVSLLSDGRFCKKLAIPAYDASDGERLYQSFLRRHTKSVDVSVETITNFAKKISGFRPRDLEQLAFRANKKFLAQASSKYFLALATAEEMDLFVPLSRLGASTEPNAAIVRWSSIGGLFKAKAELTSTILRPFIYKQIYARAQIRLPRGILLYGFPGTGKSMCVPALAAECGFPLIMCRGPEILDKYIGASEAKVRDLFSRAAAVAPSILFLDELDALAPKRGSDHTGVTDRVVNQLLTFLDGVEENSQNGPVYVIAATSRPDKVDPALLRPGRLEKHVYFGFAEVNDEATDLLTKLAFHYNLDPETRESVVSGEFIRNGQQQSTSIRQLSAADLKAVLNTGQLAAVHEALAQGRTKEVVPIRYDHLFAAMISARPSLSNADYLRLSEIYAAYRDDLPDRAGADGSIAAHYGKPLRIALK